MFSSMFDVGIARSSAIGNGRAPTPKRASELQPTPNQKYQICAQRDIKTGRKMQKSAKKRHQWDSNPQSLPYTEPESNALPLGHGACQISENDDMRKFSAFKINV
jgi:hypothetical protein